MTMDRSAHTTKWIPVKNLSVVWANAQRGMNVNKVKRIVEGFDPDLFDDLVVTLPNGNGIYHVIDGNHRRGAIQEIFGEEEKVPCRVINAKDPARAAQVFDKINTSRSAPTPVERFLVRVTAGEKAETEINNLVRMLGYSIAPYKSASTIPAVSALMNVYKQYGVEVLKDALMTIKATWVDEPNALNGSIINGYGSLLAEHRGHIDFRRIRELVSKNYTPGQLLGSARYHKEMAKASLPEGVRHTLVSIYNKGIRAGKLT